jgi:methylase of polypeptide subunit release factors
MFIDKVASKEKIYEDFYKVTLDGEQFVFSDQFAQTPIRIRRNGFAPKGGLYVVDYLQGEQVDGLSCLDIGCGETGIIAQYLKLFGASDVTGIDVDAGAIDHVQTSSNISQTLNWIHGDVFEGLPANQQYELIVSNPPQMPSKQILSLHDDGGIDGLHVVHRILRDARNYLQQDGRILLLLFDFLYDNVCKLTGQSVKTLADDLHYKHRVAAKFVRSVRPSGKTYENRQHIEDDFEGFQFDQSDRGLYHHFYIVEFR